MTPRKTTLLRTNIVLRWGHLLLAIAAKLTLFLLILGPSLADFGHSQRNANSQQLRINRTSVPPEHEYFATLRSERRLDNILDVTSGHVLYKLLDSNGYPDGLLHVYELTNKSDLTIDSTYRVLSAAIEPTNGHLVAITTWSPIYRALFIADLRSGTISPLSQNVNHSSVRWSPDGRHLVFVEEKEEELLEDGDSTLHLYETFTGASTVIDTVVSQVFWYSATRLMFSKREAVVSYDIGSGQFLAPLQTELRAFASGSNLLDPPWRSAVADLNLKLPFRSGETWIVTRGYNTGTHVGTDLYALDFSLSACDAYGKPIVAVAGGTVVFAGGTSANTCGSGGYGLYVTIDHGGGFVSLYGHNSSLAVSAGQTVCQGQQIASAGNSGYACGTACQQHPGTHLHFRLTQNGAAVKPEPMSGYTSLTAGNSYTSNNSECSQTPLDKSLIKADGSPTVYWYQNGKRYGIPSQAIIDKMAGMPGWNGIAAFSANLINGIPEGPVFIDSTAQSNGLLIQQTGQANVFLMEGGKRRLFNSPEALNWIYGANWFPDVIQVTSTIMSTFSQIGNPIYEVGVNPDSNIKDAFKNSYKNNVSDSNCTKPSSWKGWPGSFSECLRFPLGAVANAANSSVSGLSGKFQNFGNETLVLGSIEYSSRGTFAVYGAIYGKWKSLNYSAGACGLPTSTEYSSGGNRRSDFEGGYIYWVPGASEAVAVCGCSYSLPSAGTSHGSGAGSGSFAVTAGSGCSWSASTSASWITITSGSGTGSGTVSYSVLANSGTSSRSGAITVQGQTFTVTQAGVGCSYSVPSGDSLGSGPGFGSFAVTAGSGCSWSASTSAPWITITSGSGSGSGFVSYSVLANSGTSSRSGAITVQGQTFTVTQAGVGCSYSVPSGDSLGSGPGFGSFAVTAGSGCSWSASTSATWITITSGSGTGNGFVSYSMSANSGTSSRSGAITVQGQIFTLTQAGVSCSYSVPSGDSLGSGAGFGSFAVTAGSGFRRVCHGTLRKETPQISILLRQFQLPRSWKCSIPGTWSPQLRPTICSRTGPSSPGITPSTGSDASLLIFPIKLGPTYDFRSKCYRTIRSWPNALCSPAPMLAIPLGRQRRLLYGTWRKGSPLSVSKRG